MQSVGSLVYCSPRSVIRPAVERALALADAVHGVSSDWSPIALKAVNRGHTLRRGGSYRRNDILINSWYSVESQTAAVLHEIGHHLDHVVFGNQGYYGYESEDEDGELAELIAICQLSCPAREIERRVGANLESGERARLKQPAAGDLHEQKRLEKMVSQASRSVTGWLRLLEPKELFARAYEQWVVTEAAGKGYYDPLLRWYPPTRPGLDHETRWSYEEFRPLAHELNRIFGHYGWLGPQTPVRHWRRTR